MTDHVEYKCGDDCEMTACPYCQGGLFYCTVCHALEGALTTECCGRRITLEEEYRIYIEGNLDFKGGKWVDGPNYPRVPKQEE